MAMLLNIEEQNISEFLYLKFANDLDKLLIYIQVIGN